MTNTATTRLDAFTDAAFAFAVSLMVVGSAATVPDYPSLLFVMKSVPSFAIGFAIIVMFWLAHVRWRQSRGEGTWRSMIFSLLLVFSVLVYVHPLRAMASSFAGFLTGQTDPYGAHLFDMFAIYGIGFAVMTATMVGLFTDSLGNPKLNRKAALGVKGERIIWGILTLTGLASAIMTQLPMLRQFSPFVYATLPLTVGIFAARYDWDGTGKSKNSSPKA